MKLLGVLGDADAIEKFARVVFVVGKLAKTVVFRVTDDKLSFAQLANRQEGFCRLWTEVTTLDHFESFRFEGLDKDTANEIFFEISPEELCRVIKTSSNSSTRQVKMQLCKKEEMTFLTVKITVTGDNGPRVITHDVPITIMQQKSWTQYVEPCVPEFDVSLTISNTANNNMKNLVKIVTVMKNWSEHMELAANFNGEFRVTIETDAVKISTVFADLHYPRWEDQSQQIPPEDKGKFVTVNIDVKLFLQFILACQPVGGAEFVCSIEEDRMAHFYVTNDKDFIMQIFFPAVHT